MVGLGGDFAGVNFLSGSVVSVTGRANRNTAILSNISRRSTLRTFRFNL